jgi:uncharacterized membrane protein
MAMRTLSHVEFAAIHVLRRRGILCLILVATGAYPGTYKQKEKYDE